MTEKDFEALICSNCKHKLEKLFDKCRPFTIGINNWVDCSLFEPIKEDKNEPRN